MGRKQGQIERALAESLRNAPNPPQDEAGVALARRLAQLLDAARGQDDDAAVFNEWGVFNDLAPKYLAVLTSLGLTPAGRKGGGGAQDVRPGGGKLDELRARAETRRAGGD